MGYGTLPRVSETNHLREELEWSRRQLEGASRERDLRRALGHELERAQHRRWSLLRLALGTLILTTLGVMGSGVWLIAEGLDRVNNTLTALGVLLLVVGLLSSGVGAWKIAGVGFEIGRQPSALSEEARDAAVDDAVRSAARLRRRDDDRDRQERLGRGDP